MGWAMNRGGAVLVCHGEPGGGSSKARQCNQAATTQPSLSRPARPRPPQHSTAQHGPARPGAHPRLRRAAALSVMSSSRLAPSRPGMMKAMMTPSS